MTVVPFRAAREAPKGERSQMKTCIFSCAEMGAWRVPPFQRPVTVNFKVLELAEAIKEAGGIIPGVITLGRVKGDTAIYIVDGQHRLESFRISGLPEMLGDFRLVEFESMADMADEFVRLNSALVRMRPDDILRGLEASSPALQRIRRECKWIGYEQIRRSQASPILSMSLCLRAWGGSMPETPVMSYAKTTAPQTVAQLVDEDVDELIQFLKVAYAAWGSDPEYARLWGALNLGLNMWLWRRLVRDLGRVGTTRWIKLTLKQFSGCLMGLSADARYVDWLQGRAMRNNDRSPAYRHIKRVFTSRLQADVARQRIIFPLPIWFAN